MTQFGTAQKIVIVEDNLELSDIYKTRLGLLGYEVFAAYDGIQALMVIEREHPDLVLLDLMVPKKAGDQILEEMRESDWGKDIKVMIISNLNESEAPAGLRNLGIEGYAVKANMSNDQLDQLVDAILKPANQSEDVVLQAAQPVISEAPHQDVPLPVSANPYSGTRLQATQEAVPTQPEVIYGSASRPVPLSPIAAAGAPHANDLHSTPQTVPVTSTATAIPVTPALSMPQPLQVQPAPMEDPLSQTAPVLPPQAPPVV